MTYQRPRADKHHAEQEIKVLRLKHYKDKRTKIHGRKNLKQHARAYFVLVTIAMEMYHADNSYQRDDAERELSMQTQAFEIKQWSKLPQLRHTGHKAVDVASV